ncbi:MAG: hypothetical protein ACRER0_04715 [Gammaproteobacteria bacterium]
MARTQLSVLLNAVIILSALSVLTGCTALQQEYAADQKQQQINLEWERDGLTPEQAKKWQQLDFTPPTAYFYIHKGFSAVDAAQWRDNGFSAEQAESWLSINLSPAHAAQWAAKDIDFTEAREWIKYGYTSDVAFKWHQIGLLPDAILILKKSGFTDDDIKMWAPYVTDCGDICSDIEVDKSKAAIKWKNADVSVTEAERYDKLNIDIPTARIIKKYCKMGLEDGSIVNYNPYTIANKCYFLRAATVVQLLSRKKAVVNDAQAAIISSIFLPGQQQAAPIILEFGHFDAPAEGSVFSAIIMGKKPIVSYSVDGKEVRASGVVMYMPN